MFLKINKYYYLLKVHIDIYFILNLYNKKKKLFYNKILKYIINERERDDFSYKTI